MKPILIYTLTLFLAFNIHAQEKKTLSAYRTEETIKIDGLLNELSWSNSNIADSFSQIEPFPEQKASIKISVKMAYDNTAIYIAAEIEDNPDSIFKIFTPRDDIESSDFFEILLDPYNDGLKAFSFAISAAGVQYDASIQNDNNDENWNAVWYAAVNHHKIGWNAEIKIPYSELRFNASEIQNWGLNFFFNLRRKREFSAWNPINVKLNNILVQNGILTGLKNIEAPLRLSFMPYTTGYVIKSKDENIWGTSFKGGLDLKYGINESFTMDMMLIPDFGQVESDEQILNLGPYETYYDEKRTFFMEGIDLFSRAGIFYSRRIGGQPARFSQVYDMIYDNESVLTHPSELQLLNSTKISGKTANGYSIGLLNSVSAQSFAEIQDTITGEKREILMQALTNYNISVVEKSLPNNSYISFINTNLSRFTDQYYANNTGFESNFQTRSKKYRLFSKGAVSYKTQSSFEKNTGFFLRNYMQKMEGNFQFLLGNNIESYTYDPNDIGYIQQNNEISNFGEFFYKEFTPAKFYNSWSVGFEFEHKMLQNPITLVEYFGYFTARLETKKNLYFGLWGGLRPTDKFDYFEPRTAGYVFVIPPSNFGGVWISTNYAKKLALDISSEGSIVNEWKNNYLFLQIKPRYRIGNRILSIYSWSITKKTNEKGYVEKYDNQVIFGNRDFQSITNSFETSYIISKNASFNLRFRHNYAHVIYSHFMALTTQGELINTNYIAENANINFNALNLNATLTWQFKPGSEISVVWKKDLVSSQYFDSYYYFDNLSQSFQLPQINSLSVRVLYYIDYQNIKNII